MKDCIVVRKGEEKVEALWKKQGGVDPKTGRMWLTPRMERMARRMQEEWKKREERR